jgi:hypothetical protein
VVDCLGQDIVFAAEAIVERGFIEARGCDEIGHRSGGISARPDQIRSCIENPVLIE